MIKQVGRESRQHWELRNELFRTIAGSRITRTQKVEYHQIIINAMMISMSLSSPEIYDSLSHHWKEIGRHGEDGDVAEAYEKAIAAATEAARIKQELYDYEGARNSYVEALKIAETLNSAAVNKPPDLDEVVLKTRLDLAQCCQMLGGDSNRELGYTLIDIVLSSQSLTPRDTIRAFTVGMLCKPFDGQVFDQLHGYSTNSWLRGYMQIENIFGEYGTLSSLEPSEKINYLIARSYALVDKADAKLKLQEKCTIPHTTEETKQQPSIHLRQVFQNASNLFEQDKEEALIESSMLLNLAFDIARVETPALSSKILIAYSVLYNAQGKTSSMIDCCRMGIRLQEEETPLDTLGTLHNNLAEARMRETTNKMKNKFKILADVPEEVIESYKTALGIYEKIGYQRNMVLVLMNQAEVDNFLGKTDEAQVKLQRAQDLLIDIGGEPEYQAYIHFNQAVAYRIARDETNADKFFKKALEFDSQNTQGQFKADWEKWERGLDVNKQVIEA